VVGIVGGSFEVFKVGSKGCEGVVSGQPEGVEDLPAEPLRGW
jgi:hypothetical protein